MQTLDFLVVGAARSGTTSLHAYLRQHPEIFLPKIKEPCFFVFDGEEETFEKGKFAFAVRTWEAYLKLFRDASPIQKRGEMSTPYLYLYRKTIDTISKYIPGYKENLKIVILLRNPVDRAFSQYLWRVRDGQERLSFEDAMIAEKDRMHENLSFDYFYIDRGFYYTQVKYYLDHFKHVHIILYEDFEAQTSEVLRELCIFLGVREDFSFKPEVRHNKSSAPRSELFARLLTSESPLKYKIWYALPDTLRKKIRNTFSSLNESKSRTPVMNPEVRRKLMNIYREDVMALQKLLNRDLSNWLK